MLARTILCVALISLVDVASAQTSPPPPQHGSPVANITLRCAMVSGMAFGSYTGPKEAALKAMSGMTYRCLDREMPSTWPGHANARLTAEKDFAAAKAIDPTLSSLGHDEK